jgi:hypothetical protein
MGTATQVTVTRIAILLRHKDIEYRPEAQVPYLAYLCALALGGTFHGEGVAVVGIILQQGPDN